MKYRRETVLEKRHILRFFLLEKVRKDLRLYEYIIKRLDEIGKENKLNSSSKITIAEEKQTCLKRNI